MIEVPLVFRYGGTLKTTLKIHLYGSTAIDIASVEKNPLRAAAGDDNMAFVEVQYCSA